MRRFTLGAAAYVAACLLAILAIVIRGDGPHPRVVSIYPPPGDRYWPGGIAQITFSQSMNEASVERALQVSPGGQGQGAWYGNTLNLQPLGDWKPDVTYHLSLRGTVTDDQGRPLRTPITFWFRVHHVGRVEFCSVAAVRNVCEKVGSGKRPLTHSPQPVLQYALSPDHSMLAYTRRDSSGLPHLFLLQLDGTGTQQLTRGTTYADSSPFWTQGDNQDVSYRRRPVVRRGKRLQLGKPQLWNVQTDGSDNARL
jgi:hypothetical protein